MAKEEKNHEDGETEAESSPKKGKRLIVILLLLLALLGAGGVSLHFAGMLPMPPIGGQTEDSAAGEEGEAAGQTNGPVFYELPEFLINLNTSGKGVSFLKMTISLELPSEEMVTKVQTIEPRIVDSLNTYLREMRASDLSGSAGLYRLREELLVRINKALHPGQVNDVLFKEIIVQ